MTLSETDIIQRYFHKNPDNKYAEEHRSDITMGIGDDAAAVRVPDGMELLTAIDTIVEGVHFPVGLDAGDIGHRVLAVNLSDLAAMAAQPLWVLLSLSMPTVDEDWLSSFCKGFFALANRHDVALVGGDLVKGPVVATVTVLGSCRPGRAISRRTARVDDLLYVTGCPGSAALGLQSITTPGRQYPEHESAFRRPVPRVDEGLSLHGVATAMIDVSDGLLKDAGRIAAASGVQIRLDAAAIESASCGDLGAALSGGDDYELCFTVPPGKQAELSRLIRHWDCGAQQIGEVVSGHGIVMPGHDLDAWAEFDHFAPA